MNIVKGVADLIRRSSTGHTGESSSGAQAERFSTPTPTIRFSEVGDEAILNALWERYENAVDKVEKKKSFHVFLKHFLIVYKNWEPVDSSQLPDTSLSINQPAEYSSHKNDIVVGCSAGHPAEIVLILTEEVGKLTALVTEINTSMMQSMTDLSGPSTSSNITTEGLPVLDALTIVTRSMHNCRVFGYYGGIQKLTALMKAAVVQLKTVTGALSADESLLNFTVEKNGVLQKILVYVVSIICSFIGLNSNVYEKAQLYGNGMEFPVASVGSFLVDHSSSLKVRLCETRLQWHQKAVVSVMEAGGLNWLVELLRLIRRLSMKEQWTDISLQCLTLRTLHSALSENPRGQNHFRSIGGLEVLLDGIGVPSSSASVFKHLSCGNIGRDEKHLLIVFQVHVLSLEVLREAVFGNLNNLQFLCENGRVHKFANSFCSPAFMLPEYKLQNKDLPLQADFHLPSFESNNENNVEVHVTECVVPFMANASYSQYWNDYVVKLGKVLCSFLPAQEDTKSHNVQVLAGRNDMLVSSVYGELFLLTVFPCIKTCSNQDELPSHLVSN